MNVMNDAVTTAAPIPKGKPKATKVRKAKMINTFPERPALIYAG